MPHYPLLSQNINRRHAMGFTLMEVVIVFVIISIIAAISSVMLSEGFNAYLKGRYTQDATWQARVALARLAVDLRTIRSPSDITTATASQLIFTDISGNSVNYQLTGSNLTRNSQVLASGIGSFTFTYYDNTGTSTALLNNIYYINYSLTVTLNNTNLSYQSGIYPRDLP